MFNHGYFGKMMDRRRFLLTTAFAASSGLTFPLGKVSAAESAVRLANYERKSQSLEALKKKAVTLTNNSDVILRSPAEARKAVLSLYYNGSYVGAACCVRFAGRIFLVTVYHCFDRNVGSVDLKNCFVKNEAEKTTFLRFFDDVHDVQNNALLICNWLYCNQLSGDFIVYELKDATSPYVLDTTSSSLSIADEVEILCMSKASTIKTHKCCVRETNHRKPYGPDELILLDVVGESEVVQGDSGSPLVTPDGKFRGMLINRFRQTESQKWRGVVVPAAKIFKNVAKQFNFGYLGAYVAAGDELTVRFVDRNSPAEKAGIHVGDTILAFDDTRVENFTDFQRELSYRGSRKGTVTVKRRDKIVRLDVAFAGMRSA